MLIIRSWFELNAILEDITDAARAQVDSPTRTEERIAEATAAFRKWVNLSVESRDATERFLEVEAVDLLTGEALVKRPYPRR